MIDFAQFGFPKTGLIYRARSFLFSGEAHLQAKNSSENTIQLELQASLKPRLGPSIQYRMISLIDLEDPQRPQPLEQQEWLRNQPKRHYRPESVEPATGHFDPLYLFLTLPTRAVDSARFEERLILFGKTVPVVFEREDSVASIQQTWFAQLLQGSSSHDPKTLRFYLNTTTSLIEKIETQSLFGQTLTLVREE